MLMEVKQVKVRKKSLWVTNELRIVSVKMLQGGATRGEADGRNVDC